MKKNEAVVEDDSAVEYEDFTEEVIEIEKIDKLEQIETQTVKSKHAYEKRRRIEEKLEEIRIRKIQDYPFEEQE